MEQIPENSGQLCSTDALFASSLLNSHAPKPSFSLSQKKKSFSGAMSGKLWPSRSSACGQARAGSRRRTGCCAVGRCDALDPIPAIRWLPARACRAAAPRPPPSHSHRPGWNLSRAVRACRAGRRGRGRGLSLSCAPADATPHCGH